MATSGTLEESISRFGLTEVYAPIGGALVDVVFIHGLNGHPHHTWTSEEHQIFWPAQLLPPVVEEQKARILVYGYDADVTSFTDGATKDKIHNHAEHLVADLSANRQRRKVTQRPIIFLAHSLGGLVVKRALIYSSGIRGNYTEHLRSIFVSTYGILFLGTPHKGFKVAKWGSRLARIFDTRRQLIDALKTNNETLQNIDRQFSQIISRFHIYFFHEGKPTKLKGTLQYIVGEDSASPNTQNVERATIQQDHSHMCKFETETAPGFPLVVEGIQRFAGQAPEVIRSRWHSEKAEREKRKEAEVEELLPGTIKRSENPTILPGSSEAVKPLFLVPFSRDASFINRTEVFKDINERIQNQQRRVALSGIGGVGKSQIAIEYCYRFRDDDPHAQIVWVHGSTKQRFDQAYGDIARKLELPGWDDPSVDTLHSVFEWFNEVDNGRWLMVLDNADDLDTFFTKPISSVAESKRTLPLKDFLPQSSRGLLLITTRDKRMSGRLAGTQASVVVHRMSYPEAQGLLESQMERPDSLNIDVSKTLLDALEYIPLAITQAAAFISQNNITPTEYLEMFFTNDSDVQDLLDEDLGDLRRDSESQNSVIRTWKLSFDLIRKQKPRAAEMLSLMAVLDRQGIPESLLRNDTDRQIDVMTALGTLQAFSLISAGSDGQGYELHRLVQLATRKWLEMQGATAKWQEKALLVVAKIFPFGNFENWTSCESLLPHAQAVIQRRDTSETYPKDYARLLHKVADFDFVQGRYEIAYTRCSAAVELRKKIFGLEHVDTLNSMANLASIHTCQGRWDNAEKLEVQVLETSSRVLDAEHPDTLISMSNLASTYSDQGRWDEAEKLQVRVLEARLRVLGAEHSDTLITMSNLAFTYSEQGRWEEAEKLQVQVLEARLRVLKAEHPDTLTSINNLAQTYSEQGRWDEAEKLQVQVLETRRRVLKAEHPGTLTSMSNLAYTYWELGRWDEAEKLQVQVLEARLRVLKAEHPHTLSSMGHLASTYWSQRQWDEAEKLLVQVLETSRRVLRPEHPDTLTAMHNLACIYNSQDRHSEAIALMKSVVDLSTKTLGVNHPSTKRSIKALERWLDN